ncbi:L-2-hydroxyglutarate oxidase [Cumulibacter manganitolerans]|uniref:L-2-hydroxyglutarate oxidase n=1 Tax=Cumulibacter manganitolerans TaxID=1884992 RepID=UPI001294BAE5|nr:L-2-hydroxyglutarate oxidase [Cumulibacter manganitolerans]
MTKYVVIGAGIIGLATARAIGAADPSVEVLVLEKENRVAAHQTGRNSGVIHSGLYYAPGSKKALMCRAGAESMARFAEEHGIAMQRTGKLVVATSDAQLPALEKLLARGLENGIPVRRISPEEAREHEPHVRTVGALHVASTAIVDYRGVCEKLAEQIEQRGGEVRFDSEVTGIHHRGDQTILQTPSGPVTADVVVSCAGLYADRVAGFDLAEEKLPYRVVPFRGEYYELAPESEYLVKGLIYPVPDPELPFLGVHLTRMARGGVHAGPNAVLAMAREGYDWKTINPAELAQSLSFPGFWKMARKNLRIGAMEVRRSMSRARFAASLAELVPALRESDIVPSAAGVRAQLLTRDGQIYDDFLIERRGRNVHVLNAPSPAATAALEIGAHIASEALARA